jgi:hypothetical protein
MTDAEVLKSIVEAFKGVPRPKHFTDLENRTLRTEERPGGDTINYIMTWEDPEAREHDDILQSLDPATLSYRDLPYWGDPICFLSPEGFRYWFPGYARLALADRKEPNDHDALRHILCESISRREPSRHLRQTTLFNRAQTAATLLLLKRLREKLDEAQEPPFEHVVKALNRGIRNWEYFLSQYKVEADVDPYY